MAGADGKPILLVWIHVDDIFLHESTLAKLSEGSNLLLGTTVELGLIFQSSKTVSPTQRVKFCGFIYDTKDIPQLIIPDYKVSREISMIDYLYYGCSHLFASLVIIMVVGFL